VVSPTGVVYEPGSPPRRTRTSQTASLYVRQGRYERALELALEGMVDDPGNPVHAFLAGVAHARLGALVAADSMFDEAERLYPAYEVETEPEREAAWSRAFNLGLETYGQGDVDRTIDVWVGATTVYTLRPEAHRNLARLLSLEGAYDRAIELYQEALAGLERRPVTRILDEDELEARRVAGRDMEEQLAALLLVRERYAEVEPILRRMLDRTPDDVDIRADLARALSGLDRDTEASEIYRSLLSEGPLGAPQLSNLGIALFRTGDFARAGEAFRRLTEVQPTSRDAWFNYANALFAAEDWSALASVGSRLVELEPLGENGLLMTARAHLELGDREAARRALQSADTVPVFLDALQLRRTATGARVVGEIKGNRAPAGTPVRLLFFFYGSQGEVVGVESIAATAPAGGESRTFSVDSGARAASYRYELVR